MFSTSVDGEILNLPSQNTTFFWRTVSLAPVSESSSPLPPPFSKSLQVWLELPPQTGDKEIRSESNTGMKKPSTTAEIQTVSGPCARQVTLSSPREEISVQRRKAASGYPISFSFRTLQTLNFPRRRPKTSAWEVWPFIPFFHSNRRIDWRLAFVYLLPSR